MGLPGNVDGIRKAGCPDQQDRPRMGDRPSEITEIRPGLGLNLGHSLPTTVGVLFKQVN